jgi:sulfatase maturation enzyme AslB (radical SAM superfamily)
MPERYQISIIFTDECNMRCSYCTTAKRPVDISDSVIEKSCALIAATAPSVVSLNYHGGEPTLVWDQIERFTEVLLPQMQGRELHLNMCTNGTRIEDHQARFLKHHGFDLRLSIDGKLATHKQFRKSRDRGEEAEALYAKSLVGLACLLEHKVPTAANMVVTPDTVEQLGENAVFLLSKGLVHLVISPVVGMPWDDDSLLELNRQLKLMQAVWARWLSRADPSKREYLRRSILSEIDRAEYCIGSRMNQPDAKVIVLGPDGRIFGDEPDVRSEKNLVLGDVFSVNHFDELPELPRTAFQLMYDKEFYPPHVLRDVQRTHRLLRNRLREIYGQLFPHQLADLAHFA